MIKEIQLFLDQLKKLNTIQKLLLLMVFFIFTPVIMTNIYIVFLFLYSLKKGYLLKSIKEVHKSIYLIIFISIVIVSSLIRGNIIGFLYSIDLFICFNVIIVFRNYVDKNLFYLLIKVSTLMSIFTAFLGVYQLVNININLGIDNLLTIHNAPWQRPTAVFLNANYFATILEFVILMAFYKLFLVRDKESSIAYYILVIFINIFMLYLTGSRTAWLAIMIAIPIMFLFQKKYYIFFTLIFISLVGFLFTLQLEIFPRIGSLLSDFSVRFNIWKTGIKGFLEHPFIGSGPFTYLHIFERLGGPKAPHAHSIYIDSILSFGIIPLISFFIYLTDYLIMFFKSSHKKSYSLIIGVLTTTLVHGLFDFTILEIQVGMLFFLIISSIGISNKKVEI